MKIVGQLAHLHQSDSKTFMDNIRQNAQDPSKVQSTRFIHQPQAQQVCLTLAEVHFLYWKLGGKQIN